MQRLSPKENEVKFALGGSVPDEALAFLGDNGYVVFGGLFADGEGLG